MAENEQDDGRRMIGQVEQMLDAGNLVELPTDPLVPDLARRHFQDVAKRDTSRLYFFQTIQRYNPETNKFDEYVQIGRTSKPE